MKPSLWLTKIAALLVAALCQASALAADSPEGRWTGYWEREASRLPVEMVFTTTGGGYAGSFSSAQLRVARIPLSNVHVDGSHISWDLIGDASTSHYEGTVKGGRVSGVYRDGDAQGRFVLERDRTLEVRFEERDIPFDGDGVHLVGTLVLPEGQGPFPAVVFVHGSGPEGRWATRFLADAFARHGIAAFGFDKRGVGVSTGDWRTAGFEALVADASAAVEAIRRQPDIDPSRVGIHGHSQGGTIAPWVAVRNGHVAFVVASAGAALLPAQVERYSVGNSIGIEGLSGKQRRAAERFVDALIATAYQGAPRSRLDTVWTQVQDKPWAFKPPPATDTYWSFSRRIAGYDATRYWKQVKAPVLMLYGESDQRIQPRQNVASASQAYLGGEGTRLNVVIFAGADHNYRLSSPTQGFTWPRTAPGYPERMIAWVKDVVATGAR